MKVKVPEAGLAVATEGVKDLWDAKPSAWNPSESKREIARAAVAAFIEWLTEYPIVPTDEQLAEMGRAFEASGMEAERFYAVEWQRRMFAAPDEDSVADLVANFAENGPWGIREAYRRGLAQGEGNVRG